MDQDAIFGTGGGRRNGSAVAIVATDVASNPVNTIAGNDVSQLVVIGEPGQHRGGTAQVTES